VDLRAAQEQELVLAPEFFAVLAAEIPGCDRLDVLLKRGRHQNELTQFRYDVIIQVSGGRERPEATMLDEWPADGLEADQLRTWLAASPGGVIGFADVPNARVVQPVAAARVLGRASDAWTAGRVQAEAAASCGIDPEMFFAFAASIGGTAHVQCSLSGRPDTMDVTLASVPDAAPAFPRRLAPRRGLAACANEPLQGAFVRNLAPDLRRHLQTLLPGYMVPATFTLLGELPLGPNGKIDRAQLPSPDPGRARQGGYVAPRSDIEQRLTRLWSEVLAVPQIGVRDNFFTELGGHSLLGTQLMSRVRSAFGIDLPLSRLFAAPTVAELAVHVREALARSELDSSAALSAAPGGERSPIGAAELSAADLDLIARAMEAAGDGNP
jgi:acyl carrier protein